jgi:hypothetical protein
MTPEELAARRALWLARAAVACGAGLISYGAWRAWPPAGPLALGVQLLVIGLGALR